MKKTFKIVALLLLVLVTSTFVFAQSSNTFTATAGTLRDDADNFMDVRYYNDVDFSNFFAWTNLSLDEANLGFAKKFDALYLGAYYKGDLWSSSATDKSDNTDADIDTDSVEKTVSGDHSFDVLLGFSGMALKLDTYFDIDNNSEEMTEKGDLMSESKNNDSTYSFDLTWGGLSIPVGNVNLRPMATLGLDIKDSTEYSCNYDADGVKILETTNEANNINTLTIKLASDIEWESKESLFSVVGLSYAFKTAIGANGEIGKTTISDTSYVGFREDYKDVSNEFNSYYRFEYQASDNLKLGARVNADIKFTKNSDGYTYQDEAPEEKPEVDVKSDTDIDSEIAFGMQYRFNPKFAMNLGLKSTLPSFTSKKTVSPASKTTTVESKWNDTFSSSLRTGFVWDINENCALDAYMFIPLNPSILMDILGGGLSLGFKYKM